MPQHKKRAHPTNILKYRPWQIVDAPEQFWIGRMFRGDDINSEFPNGTVFKNLNNGKLRVCWNGISREIISLDISTRELTSG